MAVSFKGILKWIMIGGGSILSLINPAIGAPLILAGSAIKTGSETSQDLVSVYGSNLVQTLDTVNAMQAGANVNTALNNILVFIQKYFVYIIAGFAMFFFLPKLLKRRR